MNNALNTRAKQGWMKGTDCESKDIKAAMTAELRQRSSSREGDPAASNCSLGIPS